MAIHRTAEEGREPSFISLYHFCPLTNRQLFAILHACQMIITYFNRNACIYQTATGWDLPPYWVIIELLDYHLLDWLIDDAVLVCLLDDLILGFCYNYLNTGNQWIWTCNDYHLCITIEPTNQVCYSSTLTSNINISGTLFHWYI